LLYLRERKTKREREKRFYGEPHVRLRVEGGFRGTLNLVSKGKRGRRRREEKEEVEEMETVTRGGSFERLVPSSDF